MTTQIKTGEHIIFYDGVCGLCNSLVQFILAHGGGAKFLFCSLQSDVAAELLAKYGESNKDLDTVFVITDYDLPSSKLLKRSKAIFFILKHLEMPTLSPWSVLATFSFLPEFILDLGYDLIANVRYKAFGQYDACQIPAPEVAERFIDQ